jgi:signal transduction histidine kinase
VRVLRVPSGPATPLVARLARDELVQVTAATAEHPVVARLLAYYQFGVSLCVPLRRGGEMIGIQSAGYRTRTAPFTAAQERIARGIAQLASMALTNAQLVEELERASRLKSEFVSTMSHELRTPLNVILGYTDMLADMRPTDGQQRLLARVRHSSLELLEMIDATLNLNRIAAGKDAPTYEPVSLPTLWDELSSEFAALPRRSAATLRWEPPPSDRLRTDRRKLKMILKNLVGNALKFTPAGEVAVSCATAQGVCTFVVRDTGIGIPAEHLPHVFDMFRQVDSSDARSFSGAGLGLYIVRQLVDQLHGEVTVESEPGRGSTFRVALPGAPAPDRRRIAA